MANYAPTIRRRRTEEYTTAVVGAHPLRITPDEMKRSVELRRARQARLTGGG